MNKIEGDENKRQNRLQQLIATMNVFSQHQKVMAEFTKPKIGRKNKNKK